MSAVPLIFHSEQHDVEHDHIGAQKPQQIQVDARGSYVVTKDGPLPLRTIPTGTTLAPSPSDCSLRRDFGSSNSLVSMGGGSSIMLGDSRSSFGAENIANMDGPLLQNNFARCSNANGNINASPDMNALCFAPFSASKNQQGEDDLLMLSSCGAEVGDDINPEDLDPLARTTILLDEEDREEISHKKTLGEGFLQLPLIPAEQGPSSTVANAMIVAPDSVLNELYLTRKPLPDWAKLYALKTFLPLLIVWRVVALHFLGSVESVAAIQENEYVQALFPSFLYNAISLDTIAREIIVELYVMIAFFGLYGHWHDCGHYVSLWIFLIYTQICGLRFFFYDHPPLFACMLLGCCMMPYIPQMMQIHSTGIAQTEVRVPPFCPKKDDIVDTTHNKGLWAAPPYLGYNLIQLVKQTELRWCITLFFYAFPTIGGFIGLYRAYILASPTLPAPRNFENSEQLVLATILGSLVFFLADATSYVIAIFALIRLQRNQKHSKEVYKTGPYEPPRLDNDTIEKIIYKAKIFKQQGSNSTSTGSLEEIRDKGFFNAFQQQTVDCITTPAGFNSEREKARQEGEQNKSQNAISATSSMQTSASTAANSSTIASTSSISISTSKSSTNSVEDFAEFGVSSSSSITIIDDEDEHDVSDIFREMTVVLPAYMPNEEEILLDVLEYYKSEEHKYPGGYKVLLVWNSPKKGDAHKEIEEKLAEMSKEWPKLKAIRVMSSTSKADNLNVAIRMLDTDFALFNDSDTIVSAETMCRAAVHIFGPEQYDVAQARNIYCELDQSGYPTDDVEYKSRITSMLAFRDSFAQTNTFMGLLFDRTNFNGRGGFWRTSAIKEVEFDPRTLAEDHDASCRGFMYFGHRGVLDNNMLCLEREPAEWDAVNKQRRRWMHCALHIMDRTIAWHWASKFTKNLLEKWVYWYTYTEARMPTEAPIYYLFFFEIFGLCYRDVVHSPSAHALSAKVSDVASAAFSSPLLRNVPGANTLSNTLHSDAVSSAQEEHTTPLLSEKESSAADLGIVYVFLLVCIGLCLRFIYASLHVYQCRYNPAWFRANPIAHFSMNMLQSCWHKLLAYHDYYWGTGKWICTARATSNQATTAQSACPAKPELAEPLLGASS